MVLAAAAPAAGQAQIAKLRPGAISSTITEAVTVYYRGKLHSWRVPHSGKVLPVRGREWQLDDLAER